MNIPASVLTYRTPTKGDSASAGKPGTRLAITELEASAQTFPEAER